MADKKRLPNEGQYLKDMQRGLDVPQPSLMEALQRIKDQAFPSPSPTPVPPAEPPQPRRDVRTMQESNANLERMDYNVAQGLPRMDGINPAGQMPSGPLPAPAEAPVVPQLREKKAALQRMAAPTTQDFGRVELDESLPDLESQVNEARTRAMSPVSKNAQPALPAPVGADEDEEIKRAEQLARTRNR